MLTPFLQTGAVFTDVQPASASESVKIPKSGFDLNLRKTGSKGSRRTWNFQLVKNKLHWRSVRADFVKEVIRPDVLRRDSACDAAERIPWDWIRAADALGSCAPLGFSPSSAGAAGRHHDHVRVGEETGVGIWFCRDQ